MAVEIKDVKLTVNKPDVNFNTKAFSRNEKKDAKKQQAILIGATALTVGAAVVSKFLRAKKKLKKKK